jgi:uncharacterized ion transporter superfamily protein YfcC
MSQVSKTEEPLAAPKKKPVHINAFALLFGVVILAMILTWILPAGEYSRVEVDGRTMVEADSFKWTESSPVNPFDMVKAIHKGMVEASGIIFFVLIIGGFFGVFSATGTIDVLIATMARKLAKREKLLIPIMMLFFAAGGSLMGMAEEGLAYIPLLIPLAIALGFDTITGMAIVLLGAAAGFTTAVMNPFTVGIAQGIAELPLFSGIGLRLILFVVVYLVSVIFVYRYAMKVKRNPELGFYGNYDKSAADQLLKSKVNLTTKHKLILGAFLSTYVVLAYGVIKYEWYLSEIAALFIILTILIGVIGKLSIDDLVKNFMSGSAALITGALIIGVSRATLVVLNQGHIVDPMLHGVSEAISHVPGTISVIGMYSFQTVIHFILASGSGHAMLTMPIMTPLADLLDITRQTAVLSFSFADGIGNIIFPTAGTLMAGLAIAGIPWTKWAKWVLPLVIIQFVIGLIAVVIAHLINYGPF